MQNRFGYLLEQNLSTISTNQRRNKCESCSILTDQTFYERQILDRNPFEKARRFREDLRPKKLKNFLQHRIYIINKSYLKMRIKNENLERFNKIQKDFKSAAENDDAFLILTAYSFCQQFSKLLNCDMARNVIHDITTGCSQFCCECLYSTEDGTKSLITLLLYHPQFKELNFIGTVYRGFPLDKSKFSHYTDGACFITTTWLSSSKDRRVAEMFSGQDNGFLGVDKLSIICIYNIKNEDRTALNIAKYSQFPGEEEILILPYSCFRITRIVLSNQQQHVEIYFDELTE